MKTYLFQSEDGWYTEPEQDMTPDKARGHAQEAADYLGVNMVVVECGMGVRPAIKFRVRPEVQG